LDKWDLKEFLLGVKIKDNPKGNLSILTKKDIKNDNYHEFLLLQSNSLKDAKQKYPSAQLSWEKDREKYNKQNFVKEFWSKK